MNTNLIEDLRLLSPPNYHIWLIIGAVAILACLSLGLALKRRRKTQPTIASSGQVVSDPWDLAFAELERLLPLLTKDHSREYGIRSTAILRRYIETRYELRAPKLTTEEFLVFAGASRALSAAQRGALAQFLNACDLLKFGRYLANQSELEPLHATAVGFLLACRPSEGGLPSPPA